MLYKYNVYLSSALYELKMLYKELNKPGMEIVQRGFCCPCKKALIKNYINCLSNLMILISSIIQEIHNIPSGDALSNRLRTIWKSFKDIQYQIIYNSNNCALSTCFFDIMQTQFEEVFFSNIYNLLYTQINSHVKPQDMMTQELLDEIYDVGETALFYLSGLHIKCSNIKIDILQDKFFNNHNLEERRFKRDFTECNLETKDGHECLHLFITPSMMKIESWLENYFDLYAKYHKYANKIIVIIDYRLMSDTGYTWDSTSIKRYEKALNIFGNVYFINYEGIDFGDYTNKVNLTTFDELTSCIV